MDEAIEYIEDEKEDDALDDNIEDKSEWPSHLDVDIKKASLRFRKIKQLLKAQLSRQ